MLEGNHPKESTPADRLPRVEVGHEEWRVLTPQEFMELADAIEEEWRPWLVLGAFCGLRPEEIAPTRRKGFSKSGKRGLLREEIDFRFKVIHLPAEEMGTSETMLRRHYHNPRTKEEGEAWFEMRPKVIRYDPMESTLDSENKKSGVR